MSRNLTASGRRSLIRLASTMPVGSPERKAILKGLSKTKVALGSAAKDVAAKLVRMMPGAELFGVTGGGVGVSLGGYAETGRKDNYSHAGVMNDSIVLYHETGPSLRGKFDTFPGQEDAFGDGYDEIVVKTDMGRRDAFRVPWTGSADKAAREIAKRLGGRMATSKVGGFKYGDLYDALESGAEAYAMETLGAMETDLGFPTGRPSRLSGDAKMLKWGLGFDLNNVDFEVIIEVYNFESAAIRVRADGRDVFYKNKGLYRDSAPWEMAKSVKAAIDKGLVEAQERAFARRS